MEAVSIQELAANNESSWMSQAPNLHLAMQLLKTLMLHHSASRYHPKPFIIIIIAHYASRRIRPTQTLHVPLFYPQEMGKTCQ